MRRMLVVLSLVVLAGCSDFKSIFQGHADVAATAGELELTPERLSEILTGPKGVRLNSDAAEYVTGLWMDYALFAHAVAEGKLPADSATIAQALWPALVEIKDARWKDTLLAMASNLSDTQVDSLFNGDAYRLLQHILFTVPQTATPEQRSAVRADAERALERLRNGASFEVLARQLSQDPQSAQDSGYLPPAPRGAYTTAFDSAGWSLAPGAMSGIVETPYGYHIIRRPSVATSGDRMKEAARLIMASRLDSLYIDSLSASRNLEIRKNAPRDMREALEDVEGHRGDDTLLATFSGGSLTVSDFLRWVSQLPPAFQMQIVTLPDSQLTMYAKLVAQNELVLAQADSAGIGPTELEWASIRQQYQGQVDSLKNEMALGSDITDSTIALSQRLQVADLKVKQYFDRVISGDVRARRVPALLGDVLRERIDHEIYPAGIARGLQLAQAAQAQDTSAPAGPGQMAPPPGGAPGQVPGQLPAPADSVPVGSGK